jgi:hypothetical protein
MFKGVAMKRFMMITLFIITGIQANKSPVKIVAQAVKSAAGQTNAKERLKTIGSVAFAVGGTIYLLASYQENNKFDKMKEEYTYEKSGSEQTQRLLTAGRIEGQFNLWRGIRYAATCSTIAGSFLLGISMEDAFNLI